MVVVVVVAAAAAVAVAVYVVVVVATFALFSCLVAKIATSSYRLQGHEGRSVQFTTCVKDEMLYASSKLHTPAFITLELQSCAENVLILKSKH